MVCLPVALLGVPAYAEDRASPVEVAPVEEREVAAPRTFVGSVVPSRFSLVGSEVEGHVLEYFAEEGRRVEVGAELARLRTDVIEARLAAARAELEIRRHELTELENGSRPEEINQSRARVEEVEAQVEIRKWKLEAAQRLFDQDTISEDELRDARSALRVAEHLLNALRAALALVEEGPRPERIAQARARVDVQAAEVRRLEDEEGKHVIRAPFAGWIVAERTEVGQWLDRGGAVVEIAALDEVDVLVHVLEDYVGVLRPGLEVTVSFGALPDLPLELTTGTIDAIVPRADARSRTFPVRIRLANRRDGDFVLLKAGMFARATLPVGKPVEALLVPKDALVLGGPSPIVYVVDPVSSEVRPVPVELGSAYEGMVQVTGALEVGQQVVTKGNERLRPGQKVEVR
jgi:multidrug efflux pump subunit AcrA (membrane-fusion protein)